MFDGGGFYKVEIDTQGRLHNISGKTIPSGIRASTTWVTNDAMPSVG